MTRVQSTIWRTKADDRNLLTLEGDRIVVPVHEVTPIELAELGEAIAELLAELRPAPHAAPAPPALPPPRRVPPPANHYDHPRPYIRDLAAYGPP
jgi:hypothetical protein